MLRLLIILWIALAFVSCDRGEPEAPEAQGNFEAEQQVKRLRRDNEIEMNDLRGRWVAAHGLLELQRDELVKLALGHQTNDLALRDRIAGLETSIALLVEQLNAVSKKLQVREHSKPTILERLARSYEEIHCLRKQGADEAVSSVYSRYGFANEEEWSEAWMAAARSEGFEREVSSRVERLCP